MTLIMCTAENPGMSGTVYHMPYVEAVDGYRHGYMTRNGVQWTRALNHPADARCPGCAELREPTPDLLNSTRPTKAEER